MTCMVCGVQNDAVAAAVANSPTPDLTPIAWSDKVTKEGDCSNEFDVEALFDAFTEEQAKETNNCTYEQCPPLQHSPPADGISTAYIPVQSFNTTAQACTVTEFQTDSSNTAASASPPSLALPPPAISPSAKPAKKVAGRCRKRKSSNADRSLPSTQW